MTTPITLFPVPFLPDPGHRMLAAACGGDVRGQAFRAAEQVLRMLASLDPGSVRAGIRLTFRPGPDRPSRTSVDLAFAAGSEKAGATIERLAEGGPFRAAYGFGEASTAGSWALPEGIAACCEVVRREDGWESEEKRRDWNAFVPDVYYSILPFEAKDDNDWMGLDRLLDRMTSPVVVEVVVEPADVQPERLNHYRWITELIQVNQAGDDPGVDGAHAGSQVAVAQTSKLRDPMADDLLREQEDVHRKLREPHLHFSVRCWGATGEDARLVAATVAESCLGGGKYRLLGATMGAGPWDDLVKASEALEPADLLLAPEAWARLKGTPKRLRRLSHLATVDELKGLFRLPVASGSISPRTMRRTTDPKPVDDPVFSVLLGDDQERGLVTEERRFPDDLEEVFSREAEGRNELRVGLKQLNKHVFIAGVPGSGKTTAMFNIVTQLAHLPPREDGRPRVPFLVVEPAKTEYRTFKDLRTHPDPVLRELASSLRVFTVGNEDVSPFRYNPLAYPKGISLDEHIGALLSCFEAAMPLGGPLQGLLAEAVEEAYSHPPEGAEFPRLKDVLAVARRIVAGKGYEGEVLGNLKAALDVRLGSLVRRSLGKVFDCEVGVPDLQELFAENVILEMDYLTPDHACLMTLFVLTSMREQIRLTRRSGAPLSHVTILEEAHNIVGRSGPAQASESTADPKAFAAQYVARMLAELRALGEGIVIADQLPSAVAPEVVKNTGTKLAHRLVANEDREDLGGTMLLDGAGMEELARLEVGEAYLYTEGLHRPRRIRAIDSSSYLGLGRPADAKGRHRMPEPPGRSEILGLLEQDPWFVESRRKRAEDELARTERPVKGLDREVGRAKAALQESRQVAVALRRGETPADAAALPARLRSAIPLLKAALEELDRPPDPVTRVLGRLEETRDVGERAGALRTKMGRLRAETGRLVESLELEAGRIDTLLNPTGGA